MDATTREKVVGLVTVVAVAAALMLPAAITIGFQPTTTWVWWCLAVGSLGLVLAAWQWTRRSFVILAVAWLAVGVVLVIGLGKQLDSQIRRVDAVRTAAALELELARLNARPTSQANIDLWNAGQRSTQILCQAAGGTPGPAPKPPVLDTRRGVSAPTAQAATKPGCDLSPIPAYRARWKPRATTPSTAAAPKPTLSAADVHALAYGTAQAERDVAAASDALRGTKDLSGADQTLTATEARGPSTDVFTQLSAGGAALVDSIRGNDPPSTTLSTPAWIVLLVALMLIVRWLLVINSWNGWGPIEVDVDDQADKDLQADDKRRLATLRSYLIANVPEPAAAPGSDAITQVSDLASAPTFGGVSWVKGVATFVAWALVPPTGHVVRFSYRESTPASDGAAGSPAAGAGTGTPGAGGSASVGPDAAASPGGGSAKPVDGTVSIITVRISTRGRSRLLETKTLWRAKEDDALRAAAYWAAGWIVWNATFIPRWAKWAPDAGPYLGDYQAALEALHDPAKASAPEPTAGAATTAPPPAPGAPVPADDAAGRAETAAQQARDAADEAKAAAAEVAGLIEEGLNVTIVDETVITESVRITPDAFRMPRFQVMTVAGPQFGTGLVSEGLEGGDATTDPGPGSGATGGPAVANRLVALLENARIESPRSALVLMRLAECYQYQEPAEDPDKDLKALELNLTARSLFPTYPVAGYRAGALFGAVAHDPSQAKKQLGPESDLAGRLRSLVAEPGTALTIKDGDGAEAVTKELAEVGIKLIKAAGDQFGHRTALVWWALARSERRYWLQRWGRASRIRDSYLSANCVLEVTKLTGGTRGAVAAATPDLATQIKKAEDSGAWANLLYNVACAQAIKAGAYVPPLDPELKPDPKRPTPSTPAELTRMDQAVDWLAQARLRYGGEQIRSAWLAADPDLANIQDYPRFKAFRDSLVIRTPEPAGAKDSSVQGPDSTT